MIFSQTDILEYYYWFNSALALMQRICVIMMIAYLAIRLNWLRQVLRGMQNCWQYVFITALFFGIFAIVGSHNGLIINISTEKISNWTEMIISKPLEKSQEIISFRDAMILSAGLMGGIKVGLVAGLLAGIERYWLGGFTSIISFIMTLLLGLTAGLIGQFFPHWVNSIKETLSIAFILIVIQHAIFALLIALLIEYDIKDHPILALLSEYNTNVIPSCIDTAALIKKIILPSLVVNFGGCVLFTLVMKDLERDRLRDEAQRAELRALHAQVEPHFLNNTLSAIQDLTVTNPEKARAYLSKLAVFFNDTRKSASLIKITVEQELIQVQQYIDFQQLRFKEKVIFEITVPNRIFNYELPPCSVRTLVENALTHARRDLNRPLSIIISGEETINSVILHVRDNGKGIAPERLPLLTKQIVKSDSGSGTALYYLNQSLLLAFRGQAKLTVDSIENKGTIVSLSFPKELVRW
ncbi:MAG: LytS/YhcK type 5TM receptor domain-containing protein [Methylococcaceae bacterium]